MFAYQFYVIEFLGYPMIILNSTTDYAAQARSIHVSWLLNSTPPGDILSDKGRRRVQSCLASISCENEYTLWVRILAMHLATNLNCIANQQWFMKHSTVVI